MTLVEMLERNALDKPDKLALVYRDVRLNYREFNGHVNMIANSLQALGVKKGDRIGLMLLRCPELIIAFLASVKIGAIPMPINYNLAREQFTKLLLSMKPHLIFTNAKFLSLLNEPIAIMGANIVVTDNADSLHLNWNELLKNSNAASKVSISDNDVAYLNFTSGSTGEQKGAIATHGNIYWNTISAVEAFNITEDDIHLCMFAPFAHPHELFARAVYTGGTMVLLDEISPKSLARTIKENNVTCMMGLAPMYELLLDVAGAHDLDCLRVPESGGMYTKPDIIERFENTFGVTIYAVWGSTETTGIAIANRIGDKRKDSSIGRACPYYKVKVVDERGLEVKTGEVGEFIFKGPAVVKGYYGMHEETGHCFNDGWYFSGDIGIMDEEGFFYFVDRKNAMMKVAGLKVYPSEIEKVLLNHAKIKEAAVIGSPDGLKGEIPKALIVLRDNVILTKEEVRLFCKSSLANYKIPRIVEFINELPKTSSGKINKKALLEGCRMENN